MSQWNVKLYEDKHSYVWEYGKTILDMLAIEPGKIIIDLGCGTGQLTVEIASLGAKVIGLDISEKAIAKCLQNYPQIEFQVANGANFSYEKPVDAVFSNAALHWIHPPAGAVESIYQVLKPGGRLVAEFGGKGNIKQIIEAINTALAEPDYNPWYFPTIGEYSSLLEQQGFTVNYATLFPRPTKLEGEHGLANWLEMFAKERFAALAPSTKSAIINKIESQLRPYLYQDGHWWADYQRIRVMATKPNPENLEA